MIEDGYAQWYADRLWGLLPAVYRTLDAGPAPGAPGPLRELVNRIGNQAAVVRRSIDRLGENQSIETCDDWAIPYIGDLVATRLVSCLNAAAQRIDVAKTIYYRRRAGTLGVLEELAADIALRDARVVEFFRRMGRTRHQFDPPLGYAIENPIDGPVGFTDNSLEIAEGLTGFYSGTPAGGFADLRNAYAASNTGTAFDEYAYTADLRQGSQSLGWYNIRHLGVFLWWLQAFPISAATPVSSGTAQPCFTFDPTGRDAPLFAPSQRLADSGSNMWGEDWVSPSEWELPVEIRETLWRTVPEQLYGTAFAFWVGLMAGGSSAPVPPSTVSIHPREGRFSFPGGAPAGTLTTSYYFGLLSRIGAGGYNHAILSPLEAPPAAMPVSGGLGLDAALAGVAADVTIEIADSLTYAGPTQSLTVPEGCMVVLQGASGQRPVLRWTGAKPAEWVIAGQAGEGGSQTVLVLQGMLLQGADVVLQGSFDAVYLRLMTVDPGTSGMPSSWFGTAIDGMALSPSTVWIEGNVTSLAIERSITGPIRTRNGGAIGQLTATDSVVQSIPAHAAPANGPWNPVIVDPASLAASLKYQSHPLAKTAVESSAALAAELPGYSLGKAPSDALVSGMKAAIVQFSQADAEAAWPLALADLALGFSEGVVSISRCTVLGPTHTHRLEASESILDDVATVEDSQHGCVRFTAYATGSNLHQPYRCVQVVPRAALFESRAFGRPEYAKLRSDADANIVSPASGGTILQGAQNGSEMGVYCLEQIALKRRGLALKFEEYAPIGQLPVWIDVD